MKTAGLYVHIPFCRTKCHYCSFNSFACAGAPPQDYIDSLIAQSKNCIVQAETSPVISSVFIGGGTPTIYDGKTLSRLVQSLREIFNFSDQVEFTIESNPNTVSSVLLETLLEIGINRLSVGVQAFDNKLLSTLGRSHSLEEAIGTITMAKEAGFDNINIDLMYGLPGQTAEQFMKTLDYAIEMDIAHIALYELSIEENTAFAQALKKGDLILPHESEIIAMEELVQTLLPRKGYDRYEISNYAKLGFRCGHNMNYWENGDYFGVGSGAVSYIDGIRLKNIDNPSRYSAEIASGLPGYEEAEGLSTEASFRETVIMGMRMLQGVSVENLKKRFDLNPFEYYGRTLQKLLAEELIHLDDYYLKLTPKALPVANQVLSELV